MKISLQNIIESLTVKKYEVNDENGNIDHEKSRAIAQHLILSNCEM